MQGRTCDSVFLHSAFYNALTSGALNVPKPSVLPGNDTLIHCVLAADGAFPLTRSYETICWRGTQREPKKSLITNYHEYVV